VSRFGGEEFVVVLPYTSSKGASYVADKIKNNVIKLGILHKHSEHEFVTISIGGAILQTRENSNNTLQLADKKCINLSFKGVTKLVFSPQF